MATTTAPARDGRLLHGLAQTLVIWLAIVLTVGLVRRPAALWAGILTGLLTSILLGQWHQRHARRDTAAGAFTGTGLWPVLIGAALIAINLVSMMTSDFE